MKKSLPDRLAALEKFLRDNGRDKAADDVARAIKLLFLAAAARQVLKD